MKIFLSIFAAAVLAIVAISGLNQGIDSMSEYFCLIGVFFGSIFFLGLSSYSFFYDKKISMSFALLFFFLISLGTFWWESNIMWLVGFFGFFLTFIIKGIYNSQTKEEKRANSFISSRMKGRENF